MNLTEDDLEPLPPLVRRLLWGTGIAIALIVVTSVAWAGTYVALMFGWHPISVPQSESIRSSKGFRALGDTRVLTS